MSDFPPRTLADFLQCCAGEWLTVRSRFQLQAETPRGGLGLAARDSRLDPESGGDTQGAMLDERWHDADKGALRVVYLDPLSAGDPGGLEVTPPLAEGRTLPPVQVHFLAGGDFRSLGAGGESLGSGSWELWPDGSLELTARGIQAVVRERIWFTKPNLRLRSSVERRHDGRPDRASFSSEIRRVARAAAPAP